MYGARNGQAAGADYVRFGHGNRVLILLPGLGDGLRTVKGTALPMAWMYRMFADTFTVYLFSRKQDLPQGYTTRQMARDLRDAMEELNIPKADVLGVSMGGMIAQWLAIDSPERVGRLILAVTAASPNSLMTAAIEEWMHQARQGDHGALMDSNLRKIYSQGYYRKNRWILPLVARFTKPRSYDRFLIQAEACLSHDTLAAVPRISSPVLIIGGEQDAVLGADASRILAREIPGSRLILYPQWGHGLYEEAADFNDVVMDFLTQ